MGKETNERISSINENATNGSCLKKGSEKNTTAMRFVTLTSLTKKKKRKVEEKKEEENKKEEKKKEK